MFKDGWVPPEYVGSKDIPANISAAVAANAAAVAQMNDQQKRVWKQENVLLCTGNLWGSMAVVSYNTSH